MPDREEAYNCPCIRTDCSGHLFPRHCGRVRPEGYSRCYPCEGRHRHRLEQYALE